ncbi:GNAT family N-acetyltransferase [Faecalibaculum rodentium]|uniref:GNAT family N-acetyltransferase n=1 Tax=Faecalibaculum rodentium TaxID=1702221 RepID=UPI0023F360C3|nr:GNAT family N-acetyltransferase [Faecalibaculum rodentium]
MMEIRMATADMAWDEHRVLQTTIRTVYPKYYPEEVAAFFCRHHSLEHIQEGISSGNLQVLVDKNRILGIGACSGNHITGVYILPEYQKQGCGTRIMNFLESKIRRKYGTAILEASLPGVFMYERRGYRTTGHGLIELADGVRLVYEIMEKEL